MENDPYSTFSLMIFNHSSYQHCILQVFVAATFYIGKGKRGRPYAHFYEALSSMKPPKDKDADKSAKAAEKQVSIQISNIFKHNNVIELYLGCFF